MVTLISICNDGVIGTMGMRATAIPYRQNIESALEAGEQVTVDFSFLQVTQSFIDELLGNIILRKGMDVLKKLDFKNCNKDVQSIIRFVVTDRARQWQTVA